jgi:hypothetical protein
MSEPLYVGTVKPPADMMEAARLSLSDTAFANLMERTGGKAPTPAELCEFADAERLAHEATRVINGAVEATVEQVGALFSGEVSGGVVNVAAPLVGESGPEYFVPASAST